MNKRQYDYKDSMIIVMMINRTEVNLISLDA